MNEKNETNLTEVDYTNPLFLFAINIECKVCGCDKITIFFNGENNSLVFKCNNGDCESENIIDIMYL